MRDLEGSPTVIFVHLGKTGGSTLRRVIPGNYPVSRVMSLRNPPTSPNGFLSRVPIEEFARLPDADRAHPRFIMAHMMFGLHEAVPRPSTYITLMREPVARAISGYKKALNTPSHRLHETVTEGKMDIEQFVQSGVALEMDNSQMRAIIGDAETPYGACTDAMLAAAKRTIEQHFSVVGLVERFDETLTLMGHVFGWKKLCYVKANVSRARMPRASIAPETIELIEHQNRFDIELYRYAQGRLAQQRSEIASFDRDLARFTQANARYRPWGYLTYTLPAKFRERLRAR